MAIFVVGEHAVNDRRRRWPSAHVTGVVSGGSSNRDRTRAPATVKAYVKRGTLLLEMATRETGIDPLTRRSSSPSGSWAKRIAGPGPRSGLISSLNPGMLVYLGILKPARSKLIDTALDLLAEVVDPKPAGLAAPRAIRRLGAQARASGSP